MIEIFQVNSDFPWYMIWLILQCLISDLSVF